MKNIFKHFLLITILFILYTGVQAQTQTNSKQNPAAEQQVKIGVVPANSLNPESALKQSKLATRSVPDSQMSVQAAKPREIQVMFKQQPANLNQVLPKEDVKPVLPATIKMPEQTTQAVKVEMPNKIMGPKVAPLN